MATVTKTIGTSSRDYSTIQAWEDDLDVGATYSSGDDAVGECYNDSAFNETVTINGGGTVGLNSITLTVASGERHDGTAGTGARIDASSTPKNIVVTTSVNPITIEWLEIDENTLEQSGSIEIIEGRNYSGEARYRYLLIHHADATVSTYGIYVEGSNSFAARCIVYAMDNSADFGAFNHAFHIGDNMNNAGGAYNCTAHDITSGHPSPSNRGFRNDGGGFDVMAPFVKNCLATNCDDACFHWGGSFQKGDYNCSSDATADDVEVTTNSSVINVTTANQYVSTTGGSEDLHLKSGADAIDVAADLVNTPVGVKTDIDEYDVDAGGDTWDMGADEFQSAGATTPYYSGLTLMGTGV